MSMMSEKEALTGLIDSLARAADCAAEMARPPASFFAPRLRRLIESLKAAEVYARSTGYYREQTAWIKRATKMNEMQENVKLLAIHAQGPATWTKVAKTLSATKDQLALAATRRMMD